MVKIVLNLRRLLYCVVAYILMFNPRLLRIKNFRIEFFSGFLEEIKRSLCDLNSFFRMNGFAHVLRHFSPTFYGTFKIQRIQQIQNFNE